MKGIITILLLLCSCTISIAQYGYSFNRIGKDDGVGLASDIVYTTYQDKKGYIWVGTANGLQRFDGSKFIQFGISPRSKDKLPVAPLTTIFSTDANTLWLEFPQSAQFGIFNTSTFEYTIIPIEGDSTLKGKNDFTLWKDNNGEVFVYIHNHGIYHFNKKKKAFINDNYFKFQKGWMPLRGFFEDTLKKQIWFPCGNNGIAIFDYVQQQLYTKNNNPLNLKFLNKKNDKAIITEIFIDSKRRHWIFNWVGGDHFKYCYDSAENQLKDTAGLSAVKEYAELKSFYETKQKVLWIYGANALFNFDNDKKRFFFYDNQFGNSINSIQYQVVYNIMEDHDGGLWFSTDNGLYFTSPSSGTFSIVEMLFSEQKGGIEITDILELKSGQYWLSTWGKGVISFDSSLQKNYVDLYKSLSKSNRLKWNELHQVWSLYQHIDGKVWIGCQGGNYMIYDTSKKTTSYNENAIFEHATIRYITGDKKGNIWFSTQRGHLIKCNGKTFSLVQKFSSIVPKIFIDNEGLLWVPVNANGLYCLSADGTKILKHFTNTDKTNALFQNSGNDIEQLNDSTIVFAAGAMNFINKKSFTVSWLTFVDGLPSNSINRIRLDKEGYLWMNTSNGLCRYSPITKKITPYGKKDGISLARFTTEADLVCSKGFLIFAGSNAMMLFHPSIFKNIAPPDVVITDVKLFNTFLPVDSLQASKKIIFSSNENSLSFYFSALSYVQKEKLTYYYKLDGIDKDWVKTDRSYYVNYTFLPPGKYTFSVYCENIDGVRSKNITSFSFHIKPPFWRTWWFLSCMLFIVALIIYAVHITRVNKLLAVEKLRNRVARDLHDDMGSTLSTINILSAMAKSKMNTDAIKTAEFISKISDNSQRMMEAMDDIVWSIKPSNDTMQKVLARMREFATNVLEAKDIELELLIDENVYDAKLNMEARKDFFLIFKEAVNNAAKYSKASKVIIDVRLINKHIHLIMKDNGVGFDVKTADGGNGLGNMHKRSDAMNAKLYITSAYTKGTTVELIIPVQ